MLNWLRAVARFFTNTIGWNRIGFLLSVAIIAVAVFVLVHMLHDLDIDQVFAALKAVTPHRIAVAAVFVAGGYFTLTFYDWFALRTIGRPDVPYYTAALSGFTSYAVGHNIGATVFTGGAVRYRIYSARGLTAVEVAKICFVAGLTFWLGNATVLGLSVALDPHAAGPITQLPGWINRLIAFGILGVLFSYIGWVWSAPRTIGTPTGRSNCRAGRRRCCRLCIGMFDLGLLRAGHVHAAADRASHRLRHHRGGVRVGDLARLRQPCARRARRVRRGDAGRRCGSSTRKTLVAGLLLFRLLYYIVPFAHCADHSWHARNMAQSASCAGSAGPR